MVLEGCAFVAVSRGGTWSGHECVYCHVRGAHGLQRTLDTIDIFAKTCVQKPIEQGLYYMKRDANTLACRSATSPPKDRHERMKYYEGSLSTGDTGGRGPGLLDLSHDISTVLIL